MTSRSTPSWPAAALVLCTSAAGCMGTPTPEPPDFLPTPDAGLIDTGVVGASEVGEEVLVFPPVKLSGAPGAVRGGSDVWLVNLDNPLVAPVTVQAARNGSFEAEIAAEPGDRVRLVSRTAAAHSAALDFTVVRSNRNLGLRLGVDPGFGCITLTPSDELTLTGEGELQVENDCAGALTVAQASLRLGDQGFVLEMPAGTIPAQGSLAVRVRYSGEDKDEQADVLLLDLDDGTDVSRHALGLFGRR